jgi:hypothetical protein
MVIEDLTKEKEKKMSEGEGAIIREGRRNEDKTVRLFPRHRVASPVRVAETQYGGRHVPG